MSVDLGRIEIIFGEAITKAGAAARTAYLTDACGDDTALRQRIEALLAAHDATGNLLKLPEPDSTVAYRPLSEGPGTKIGRYKLLEQIGEGGFGAVFMAEQEEPVRRRVALKIIKLGMDTRQVVARFEAERQALAMMDDPHIAKVFDAGSTDTGRPYFVMELVRGVPITQYCDENRLSTIERLKLCTVVCMAMQHAHQKGIIHRDLKPTNILVTLHAGRPVPKIIDFGIAKATHARLTEKTLFTEFRQMIGTPAYMSPEQAQMCGIDVDTRSDIYSLGVLLYELLTGTTPFSSQDLASAGYVEMQRMIREVTPPPPSTRLFDSQASLAAVSAQRQSEPAKLTKIVRGDLDWIVMRCLEKDRTRRYETATGLAQDIERYLSDEPVEARRPTRLYRINKFIRRNRVGVLASSAVIFALVLGLALASVGFVQARRQAVIARTQAARATRVQHFLQEMLESVDPNSGMGQATTVQQMIDHAGDKIDAAFANEGDTRAVLHETIGRAYFGMQLFNPAIRHLQLAVDLRRHVTDDPVSLAEALYSLADSQTPGTAHHQQALDNCREAVAILAAHLPADDPRLALARALEGQLSRQALNGDKIDPDAFIAALFPIAMMLSDDQLARSPADWSSAVAEAKRLHRADDDVGARAVLQNWESVRVATLSDLCRRGQQDAARDEMRKVYAPLLSTPVVGPLVPLGLIGEAHSLNGKDPLLIEAILREAAAAGHSVLGPEHPTIAWALSDLAMNLMGQGKIDEAESVGRESLAMRRKLLGNNNPATIESLRCLSEVLQREGKADEAEQLRREAGVLTAEPAPATQP